MEDLALLNRNPSLTVPEDVFYCVHRYAWNWDRMTSRRSDDYLTPKYKYRNASASSSSENTDEGNQRSVRKNGRFINPWPSAKLPTFGMLLKFLWFTKNNSRVPSQQVSEPGDHIMQAQVSLWYLNWTHIWQVVTIFVRSHAHAWIHAHPSFSTEWMHSGLGVFHFIFTFCGMLVVQNVEYHKKCPAQQQPHTCLYCIHR